jgi:membrane-bound lytic murein transglycosylase D
MSKNPTQYGLEHLKPDPPLPADTVTIKYPVDLRLVAECVDTSVAALQELNPSLLRLTTPKDRAFDLRVPAGSKAKFEEAIAAIPADMRVWWRYHRVQPGDTLAGIARKYHTTAGAIEQVNSLRSDELRPESKLIIPVTPGREREGLTFAKRGTRYKVRKGDTVLSVADDFGVPVERLRKWNRLRGNTLVAGRVLTIYRPVAGAEPAEGASESRTRTVEASAHIPKSRDARATEQDPPVAAKASKRNVGTVSKSAKNNKLQASRITHRVKRGETLSSIASTYNVSVSELRKNNRKVASNLQAGDVLVIK